MPYIEVSDRKMIDKQVNELVVAIKKTMVEWPNMDAGIMLYCIKELILDVMECNDNPRYTKLNTIQGVLTCVRNEIKRRTKIKTEDTDDFIGYDEAADGDIDDAIMSLSIEFNKINTSADKRDIDGILNYTITRLLLESLDENSVGYYESILEQTSKEIDEGIIGPYENKKIAQNGDLACIDGWIRKRMQHVEDRSGAWD